MHRITIAVRIVPVIAKRWDIELCWRANNNFRHSTVQLDPPGNTDPTRIRKFTDGLAVRAPHHDGENLFRISLVQIQKHWLPGTGLSRSFAGDLATNGGILSDVRSSLGRREGLADKS